jgi:uncharacterized protein YndB with AHSA1/START domain
VSVVSTYRDVSVHCPPPHHAVEAVLRAPIPRSDAWGAIATPPQVRCWFGTLWSELAPGVQTRLDFGDGDFFTLAVDRVEPLRLLEYRWRFLGTSPESVVTWTIGSPDEFESLVTVRDDEPERSHEASLALAAGWADFLTRLARFLETGSRSRYAWRPEVDGAIELPASLGAARELLADPRWLPVGDAGLVDGGSFRVEDGHELVVRHVERAGPDEVRFALGLAGFDVTTGCSVRLVPRSRSVLLEFQHAGLADLPLEEPARKLLRARLVRTWIASLERARAAAPGMSPPR